MVSKTLISRVPVAWFPPEKGYVEAQNIKRLTLSVLCNEIVNALRDAHLKVLKVEIKTQNFDFSRSFARFCPEKEDMNLREHSQLMVKVRLDKRLDYLSCIT
jgi:hypothetical protein